MNERTKEQIKSITCTMASHSYDVTVVFTKFEFNLSVSFFALPVTQQSCRHCSSSQHIDHVVMNTCVCYFISSEIFTNTITSVRFSVLQEFKDCPFTKTLKTPAALYNHSRIHCRHVEERIPRNKIFPRMSVLCFSWSTNSAHIMESKIPLPCSQQAGTCSCPQPDNSSLHLPIISLYVLF